MTWRELAAGLALAARILLMALAAYWLYVRFTVPDCGLCDDAATSVSQAPGP